MTLYGNMGTDHRGNRFEVVLEFGSTKRCQKGVSVYILAMGKRQNIHGTYRGP